MCFYKHAAESCPLFSAPSSTAVEKTKMNARRSHATTARALQARALPTPTDKLVRCVDSSIFQGEADSTAITNNFPGMLGTCPCPSKDGTCLADCLILDGRPVGSMRCSDCVCRSGN